MNANSIYRQPLSSLFNCGLATREWRKLKKREIISKLVPLLPEIRGKLCQKRIEANTHTYTHTGGRVCETNIRACETNMTY